MVFAFVVLFQGMIMASQSAAEAERDNGRRKAAMSAPCAWLLFVCCAISVCSVNAADLSVRVIDARGSGVADAVVTVVPRAGAGVPVPAQFVATTKVIDQKNETFIPYIEIFRPGDKVVFHNSDRTRHHAYSFAPARQFEFVLAPGESSPPLPLEHAGVIAVGCNIHDQMITYFYVSEAPWIARSAADGRIVIRDLPPGDFEVRAWHPRLRPRQADPVQALNIGSAAERKELAFSLSLLPDPRTANDRERANY
jgi:plastocyanin